MQSDSRQHPLAKASKWTKTPSETPQCPPASLHLRKLCSQTEWSACAVPSPPPAPQTRGRLPSTDGLLPELSETVSFSHDTTLT